MGMWVGGCVWLASCEHSESKLLVWYGAGVV